jgi:hypothetical protein
VSVMVYGSVGGWVTFLVRRLFKKGGGFGVYTILDTKIAGVCKTVCKVAAH